MKSKVAFLTFLFVLGSLVPFAVGQSLISGDVVGTVTDTSGAVVPDATVTLNSSAKGQTRTTSTSSTGFYRFSLLQPGEYMVEIKHQGFAPVQQKVVVAVGQSAISNLRLVVTGQVQTVEVSAETVNVIASAPNPSTTFDQQAISALPNPGGDITNIAQTAPGAVMNNTGGYGNFTMNGMPATSNLFTTNGENTMDPYFNINNTGATNLTIGSNEVQEATVLANPYSGEYGQLAGAQVTYVTRSGSNQFHGNAMYWWNGRALNANNWIVKNGDPTTERPFSNANQWAASIGGPIIKNKTFFFFDVEGLRFVLPNVFNVTTPTPAFASAVLNNIQANQPNSYGLYKQLFDLYANAPGAGSAQAIENSDACNALSLTGFNSATQACSQSFTTAPTMLGKEWVLAFRIDQNIGQNDKLFGRYKQDRGTQPTYLDPISSAFNALSDQPSWDVQVQETHVFSSNMTNAFTAAGSHYVAQFQQSQPDAFNAFPFRFSTGGSIPWTVFNPMSSFPQGRNITQYQFIDDFSWVKGNHAFKFGGNFRRYDVSDHNFFYNYGRVNVGNNVTYTDPETQEKNTIYGLQLFSDGYAHHYRQAYNVASNVPIAMWGLGVYAMDEWKIKPNFTLTAALRFERNSNPVCQTDCFANFKTDFYHLASYTSADPGSVPYTADIATGLHQAYPGVDAINISPRLGFSWSTNQGRTVISGGFGLFYDNPAAGMVDTLLANPPISTLFLVQPTSAPPYGTLWADPGSNGSQAVYQASAQAFNQGYKAGKTYSQIAAELSAMGVDFTPPTFVGINGTIHSPQWQEWNLQVQQQLNKDMALVLNYVGNHGIQIPYQNDFLNAYDADGVYPTGTFAGGPAIPNYGVVGQISSGAVSNYNGLIVSLRKNLSHWWAAHLNYTWSHNLDEMSNGGLFVYSAAADALPLLQICPQSLRACNYGNSDYDVRHLLTGDFIFQPKFGVSNGFMKHLVNGWEMDGKIFWRSGIPFSVADNNQYLSNYDGTMLGYPIGPVASPSCGSGAASATYSATPCLNAAAFFDGTSGTYPGISGQRRNSLFGPGFFDLDLGLTKHFKLTERLDFAFSAQMYNAFNHPNFTNPYADLSDLTTFGQIDTMQNMPTSPYGTFLGFDSSVRVIQLSGKISF